MNQQLEVSQERRNILIGAGTAAGLGALALATAGEAFAAGVGHHHHASSSGKNRALAGALHRCIASAEACIGHYLIQFRSGKTSLAECAISAQEAVAFCTAHARMASYDSAYLHDKASWVSTYVQHVKKHPECRVCAEACLDCIKACKAFIA